MCNIENKCKICKNIVENKSVTLKSTLYGTKGEWQYFICGSCGCLQIDEFPRDISKYYSNDFYYSMNTDSKSIKNRLLREELKYEIFGKSLVGKITRFLYPIDYQHYRLVGVEGKILDVGCGDGAILNRLASLGYKYLRGIDPFIEKDITYSNGVKIYKTEITNYKSHEKYDMIVFNHALEHVDNPFEVLNTASYLLNESGKIVIKIPFFSKYYWNKYGTNLFTLDPPRHYFIHTYKSMIILLQQIGCKLDYFTTESDPAIGTMAKNAMKNRTEKNNGATLVKGTITSILSYQKRKVLDETKDGCCATFVFSKNTKI